MQLLVDDVAGFAAFALVVVFVVAAAAKLRDPRATAQAFRNMGLPRPRALGIAVPAAELTTAALLLVEPPVGAALALMMFTFFTAILVVIMRAPQPEPCNCFGSTNTRPTSWREVARNVVLGALAVAALFAAPLLTF